MKNRNIVSIFVVAVFATTASAQPYWTWGHGDIGVELHGDHFHTHWGLDTGSIVDGNPTTSRTEYQPDTLTAWIEGTFAAPAGSEGALGVATSTTVWHAGNNAYPPNLGFSADAIGEEDDWSGGFLTVSLSDWSSSNPGHFGLYSNHDGWLFSTLSSANTAANNTFDLYAADHLHFAWYFTDPGYYELEFTWTGTHIEHDFITISDTYGFYVVPEPSTWALRIGAAAGIGTLIYRRRHHKNGSLPAGVSF